MASIFGEALFVWRFCVVNLIFTKTEAQISAVWESLCPKIARAAVGLFSLDILLYPAPLAVAGRCGKRKAESIIA